MPYIELDGHAHFYEDDDFTDPWKPAEAIWIQHGWGRSSQFFYHWVPPLAGTYRVLRRDFRGHGKTFDPAPDHRWTIEELLADMRGFLDQLGLERVHYVGDSTGGILGAIFASRWPERFKSLTMMSTPIADPSRNSIRNYGYENTVVALDTMTMDEKVAATIRGRGMSVLSPEHEKWVYAEWRKNRVSSLQGMARLYPNVDITDVLPNVRTPTLVLAPSNSPTAPLAEQRRMKEMIPGACLEVIEGIGHEIFVDAADSCLKALKEFIGRVSRNELAVKRLRP